MSGRTMRADVLSELNSLTQVGVVANLSDAQLLDRFLGAGGETAEAAFHALVARHGGMVLSVCGNMLRDPNDVPGAGIPGEFDPPAQCPGRLVAGGRPARRLAGSR
jgi:hypothetical protein